MFTESGLNQMLGAWDITHVAAHTDYPGESGTNEVAGGTPAYARGAITFGAATGRTRTQSGAGVDLDVPNGDVAWFSFFNNISAGTCRAILPLGGLAREYDVEPTTDTFTAEGHGYSNGDTVVLYMSAPGGTTPGQVYFVISATTDTFQISATAGGAAVTITSRPAAGYAVVSVIDVDDGSGQRVIVAGPNITLHLAF